LRQCPAGRRDRVGERATESVQRLDKTLDD